MLAQYKQGGGATESASQTKGDVSQATPSPTRESSAAEASVDDEAQSQSKTLGRTEGPVRPID